MNSIMQVRQDMLARMEQLRELSESAPIRPGLALRGPDGGVAESFAASLRAVDAQQHQASDAAAAVSSGRSDDLTGAMIESQKASVSFSALLQVRNRLATAFDDIIKMPL